MRTKLGIVHLDVATRAALLNPRQDYLIHTM